MKKFKIITTSIIGMFAILGLGLHLNTIKLPTTVKIHAFYGENFNDSKILVGASHNIFTAKIIRQIGNKEYAQLPATQFEVEVIENIKGELSGKIVVKEQGGYKNGILYVMEDNISDFSNNYDYLLKPGSTYLLATRYNPEEDWYAVISLPVAKTIISENDNLTSAELIELGRSNHRFTAFKVAYPNEVLLDADIKHNNTRNSYKSLNSEPEKPETTPIVSETLEPAQASIATESQTPSETLVPAEEPTPLPSETPTPEAPVSE